jgi:HSP20 family protein
VPHQINGGHGRDEGEKMALRSMIPWGREHGLAGLQQSINQLFETIQSSWPVAASEPWSGVGLVPRVDVRESDEVIYVDAELPGLADKDVTVTLSAQGDAVSIRGEHQAEREHKGQHAWRTERFLGSFERSVPLPCSVDRDRVAATFKNGVLTIEMPKSAEARKATKRIPVRAS